MKKVQAGLLVLSYLLISQTALKAQNNFGNDHYNFIDVNEITMWVANNGSGSHNPNTDGSGFSWRSGLYPKASAVFQDGLVWAGIIDRKISANGNTHRLGLQAGKILSNGMPDNPNQEKYRVYKLMNGWQNLVSGDLKSAYKKDYEEWPVEDGAPWVDKNNDGKFSKGIDEPEIIGDETLWFVSNDLDTTRSTRVFGSNPVGLEIQTTVIAFNRTDVRGRTIFKKYKIINKSNKLIKDMYFGYWSDPDIGYALDDYVGCDTLLNLAYCYNADNYDQNNFGAAPPCIGYVLLQGPIVKGNPDDKAYFREAWFNGYKNLNVKSFTFSIPQWIEEPISHNWGSQEQYNSLKGVGWNRLPMINPVSNVTTTFALSGDPVNKTGWYEGEDFPNGLEPGDRRMLLGTGPFNFAPGDTQEVVIAIIVAQGSNNLNAITELKADTRRIQYFYNGVTLPTNVEEEKIVNGFSFVQNYPNPFNSNSTIEIHIVSLGMNNSSEKKMPLQLFVYDILGKKVAEFTEEIERPGIYKFYFDGGKYNLSSGIYFYQARIGDFIASKKMCLIK